MYVCQYGCQKKRKIFLVALNTIGHHIRYLQKQNYNMRGDLHALLQEAWRKLFHVGIMNNLL